MYCEKCGNELSGQYCDKCGCKNEDYNAIYKTKKYKKIVIITILVILALFGLGLIANFIWYKANWDEDTIFLSRKAEVLFDYCEWGYEDRSVLFEENHCIEFDIYIDVENKMDKMTIEVKPLHYYLCGKRDIYVTPNILTSNSDDTRPRYEKNQIKIYGEDDYSLHIQHTVPISKEDVELLSYYGVDYIVYEITIYDDDYNEISSTRQKCSF